eukprot:TRINITY_DN7725_c0_g1_i1.p1 TRINITY_DN7725_c0_g1~~TRINITY_DN7725_c0_g1_i1.p1  ORF type:complete len:321 (-),score=54.89 TRINITY_DN7725_c0_g1_i1:28-990(-)
MLLSHEHRTILAKTRLTPRHPEVSGFQKWGCQACFAFGLILSLAVAIQILLAKQNRKRSAAAIHNENSSTGDGLVATHKENSSTGDDQDMFALVPGPRCVIPSKGPSISGDALPALQRVLGFSKERLLVFEPMADAEYWVASNCNGETLLLQSPGEAIVPQSVHASSKVVTYPEADPAGIVDYEEELQRLTNEGLPHEVLTATWDTILVGSSASSSLLDIFSAHRLSGSKTVVFVDSCDNPERSPFVKRWLIKDGVELSQFSNGRGGSVCRFVPSGLGGRDDIWFASPLAILGALICVAAYRLLVAIVQVEKVRSVGSLE